MPDLVAAVQRVIVIMDSIAAAFEQQSHGIRQVNQAVAQMDQLVQQNAQLVQQAARNANALESEAARFLAAEPSSRCLSSSFTAPSLLGVAPLPSALPKPPVKPSEAWASFCCAW
jgi:methyl-accepting chemotaxis protein-2 (aspartate sensor receptor)